jgi:hypothetical protein
MIMSGQSVGPAAFSFLNEQHKKEGNRVDLTNKKYCYSVLHDGTAVIVVEGEKGCYKTDWNWGPDYKIAQEIADDRNEKILGISKIDAIKMVCASMRK